MSKATSSVKVETDLPLYPDPCMSRTVEPRRLAKPNERLLAAVDPSGYLLWETGEVMPFDLYMDSLRQLDRHTVITFAPETWLYKLHERFVDDPRWSWQVTVSKRADNPTVHNRISYYGFRSPTRNRKHNRFHLVMDANSFFRRNDQRATDLLELGLQVRRFCNEHGLELRASAAGIATQLLRHPMFYPFARRRVPGFINEAARPHLPGNHYQSFTGAAQRIDAASYIDQEAAYHYAAQTTPLPNANSVRAIGYSRNDARKYARNGTTLSERELRKHGLLCVKVRVPWLPETKRRFAPPLMQHPGYKIAYVWTNELPYLESLGLQVLHLIGLWGSDEVDNGLAKYATWAREVGKQYPQLKALLLMPYGQLARNRGEAQIHRPGGDDWLLLAGRCIDNTASFTHTVFSPTANALQLGLIQAFVRGLSLDMARQLSEGKHELVSIYADAIFVKLAHGESLQLFDPWRLKETNLELDLRESLRVPVRAKVRREYLETETRKETATR